MKPGRLLLISAFACLWAVPASAQDPAASCRSAGPPASFCIGMEKLSERGSAECRRLGAAPEASCTLPGARAVTTAAVDGYESGWIHRGLGLQYDLGRDVGFANAQWVGTHNSFNSTSESPTLSHTDSNQQYSLTDQLRMDVRSLEIDLHWIRNTTLVCHGRPESELNAGCTTERELPAVLAEIAAWLDAHPDQVLMLYVEDDMSSDTGRQDAATKLNAGLGERLYRPGGGGCTQLPGDITRDDVLAAGAQVFIVTGCDGGAGWNDTVFDWNTMHDESGGSTGFECDRTASYDEQLIRYFEDSTWLSAAIDPGERASDDRGITAATAGRMIRCGVDLLGMDQLLPGDGRLEALVWSWAPDEPAADGSCSIIGPDIRWYAVSCNETRPAACRKGVEWAISAPVAFSGAPSACAAFGALFDVPRTGWENELLAAAAAGDDVWLGQAPAGSGWSPISPR